MGRTYVTKRTGLPSNETRKENFQNGDKEKQTARGKKGGAKKTLSDTEKTNLLGANTWLEEERNYALQRYEELLAKDPDKNRKSLFASIAEELNQNFSSHRTMQAVRGVVGRAQKDLKLGLSKKAALRSFVFGIIDHKEKKPILEGNGKEYHILTATEGEMYRTIADYLHEVYGIVKTPRNIREMVQFREKSIKQQQ